jgi:hypothetical protein
MLYLESRLRRNSHEAYVHLSTHRFLAIYSGVLSAGSRGANTPIFPITNKSSKAVRLRNPHKHWFFCYGGGGSLSVVAEREATGGELVSVGMSLVFNRAKRFDEIVSVYAGSNEPQISQNAKISSKISSKLARCLAATA